MAKTTRVEIKNKVPFAEIKYNHYFEYEGDLFIRLCDKVRSDFGCYNAINLSRDGELKNFDYTIEPWVLPVESDVTITYRLKESGE